ncbi:multidrug transporter [Blastocystis sp. subtype 4]|uniref:multidrug transporter n=1 Tax=Blastocystis sp. subtype 4 TaxID=944170 RepID=UPI000711E306|nr:multidrug transporter [Blastocystis sp. subtype 4]KNB44253.1 multidrug transporter [Blastocystis sp. subtype 4]|eukprot:XP_014527696.1 multidrug transporter [Blastocystis sp. subtype 4]
MTENKTDIATTEPNSGIESEVVVIENDDLSKKSISPKLEDKEANEYSKADFMANESVGKVIWKLTYPSIIAKVVSALYAVCDTIFISNMAGDNEDDRRNALAAVTLAMPLEQGIIHSLVMMVSNGGSTLYGQSIGEKNKEKGAKTIGNTYTLEIIIAILMAIIMPLISNPFLRLLGADENTGTLKPGEDYINHLLCHVNGISRSHTRSRIISLFLSRIINFRYPEHYWRSYVLGLGVSGASLSTVLANLISGIIGMLFMRSKKAVIHFTGKDMKPDCQYDGKIMVTGMSGFVSGFAGAFVTLISNKLVLHYSPNPEDPATTSVLGAWGALSKIFFISFMPLIALAQGIMPMLAFSAGAKSHKRFMACAKLTFYWMAGITIFIEAFILIFTNWIATLFSNDPVFIEFFVPATRIVVSGVFLQPIVMVVFPMLQAIGKGGLAGMLLAMKTCFIPLILQLVMSMMMKSYWGAVYAYPIVEIVSALLAIWLFFKNKGNFMGTQLPIQQTVYSV